MSSFKLYMLLLGCKPDGRHTEQHDMLFTISDSLKNTIPAIKNFWPEAKDKIHVDAWREVKNVDGFSIEVVEKDEGNTAPQSSPNKLFFINLGGYKQNEFDEFHYKMLTVAADKGVAIQQAKQTAFYKHCGFEGANSHIDDKYGVDVDDLYEITDILPANLKDKFSLVITETDSTENDAIKLGYFKLSAL
ncbi:DUF1543 domain-containing protein [Pinibacter aurantiacus]|uniref:DUF1543 domain-containing protein n=1 Tax=Pinibacter aurantiacus TaxID=2851599 RepID=A0A9E2SA71_9BACT|nr:DUF1543 domain-containing protein [Pinibacter aurantiacus]MBV4356185.1 DUF1543 domain-containing protein [Pinibacter aurantiacus]